MSVEALDISTLSSDGRSAEFRACVSAHMSRQISWDCLAFGIGAVIATVALIAWGAGLDSVWAKLALAPLITWFLLLSFSMGHEGLHGNLIRGGRLARLINAGLSTVFAGVSLACWQGFTLTHTEHHKHTNDPVNDPNWWVVRYPGIGMSWTIVAAPFLENVENVATALRLRRYEVLAAIVIYFSVATAALITLASLIGWTDTLVLWVLPSYLNYCAIIVFVGILPHRTQAHPSVNRDAMGHDFINLRGRFVQSLVTLFHWGHNYHTLHHLYTRVPMHRFGKLARELYQKQRQIGSQPA